MTADGLAATTLVVPPAALAGETFRLEGDAYHHLVRVKRLEVGDALRMTDGAGRARYADLTSISKQNALARLGDEAPTNEPTLHVEIWTAPPKPERASWLVEKATEVGVAAIRFLPTERAARTFAAPHLDRLTRVAVAAVEQCGRARVPAIATEESLATALERRLGHSETRIIALDASGTNPFSGAFASSFLFSFSSSSAGTTEPPQAVDVALLIGPEGGWTDAERGRFAAAGAEVWSLGERALRVETAAIVAAGLVLAGGGRR